MGGGEVEEYLGACVRRGLARRVTLEDGAWGFLSTSLGAYVMRCAVGSGLSSCEYWDLLTESEKEELQAKFK